MTQQEILNQFFKVLAASKLFSELDEMTSPPTAAYFASIQTGEQDALRISLPLLRGKLGAYNAATQTPHITNGNGLEGDSYLVTEGGTVDFGNGNVNLAVNDIIEFRQGRWVHARKQLIEFHDVLPEEGVENVLYVEGGTALKFWIGETFVDAVSYELTMQKIIEALTYTPANDSEVVKTVNGETPDEDGNVEVETEETHIKDASSNFVGYIPDVASDFSDLEAKMVAGNWHGAFIKTLDGNWYFVMTTDKNTSYYVGDLVGQQVTGRIYDEDTWEIPTPNFVTLTNLYPPVQVGPFNVYANNFVDNQIDDSTIPNPSWVGALLFVKRANYVVGGGTSDVTKAYVDAADATLQQQINAIDAATVKSVSLNGGTATLPDEEGKVDLTVEASFTSIAENQYGTHPAFNNAHSFRVWVIQNIGGGTPEPTAPTLTVSNISQTGFDYLIT